MKDHIKQLNRLAEYLYNITRGKDGVSRDAIQVWQPILDEMQEELDKLANELCRPD